MTGLPPTGVPLAVVPPVLPTSSPPPPPTPAGESSSTQSEPTTQHVFPSACWHNPGPWRRHGGVRSRTGECHANGCMVLVSRLRVPAAVPPIAVPPAAPVFSVPPAAPGKLKSHSIPDFLMMSPCHSNCSCNVPPFRKPVAPLQSPF